MRIYIILFCFLLFSGCCKTSIDNEKTEEIRIKNGLRFTFIEGLVFAEEHKNDVHSISNIIAYLEPYMETNECAQILLKYGRSNIFFNPNVSFWKNPNLLNEKEKSEYGIILKRGTNDYIGTTFDWLYKKEKQPPANWCN